MGQRRLGSHLPFLGDWACRTESVAQGQCDVRPTVTFPARKHHHRLACTKLYCLVREALVHVCEQLVQGHHMKVEQPGVEPTTCWLPVQCRGLNITLTHNITKENNVEIMSHIVVRSVWQASCVGDILDVANAVARTVMSVSNIMWIYTSHKVHLIFTSFWLQRTLYSASVWIQQLRAVAALHSSQWTASSPASCKDCRPPTNFMSGHKLTIWFMVCYWPHAHRGLT